MKFYVEELFDMGYRRQNVRHSSNGREQNRMTLTYLHSLAINFISYQQYWNTTEALAFILRDLGFKDYELSLLTELYGDNYSKGKTGYGLLNNVNFDDFKQAKDHISNEDLEAWLIDRNPLRFQEYFTGRGSFLALQISFAYQIMKEKLYEDSYENFHRYDPDLQYFGDWDDPNIDESHRRLIEEEKSDYVNLDGGSRYGYPDPFTDLADDKDKGVLIIVGLVFVGILILFN